MNEYPQLDVEFIQVLQDMIGDLTNSPEPIEIKLFSQDPDSAEELGAESRRTGIKKIETVKDVKNGIENTISGSAIVMRVDPIVAARSGFTPQEIELDASAILQGEPATTPVVVNDRSYTIRVRFPDAARASLDTIRNTMIVSSTGKNATLGSLADVRERGGPDRNPARESAARSRRDRPVRRRQPGQRHADGAAGGGRAAKCRLPSASSMAAPMRNSRNHSTICCSC